MYVLTITIFKFSKVSKFCFFRVSASSGKMFGGTAFKNRKRLNFKKMFNRLKKTLCLIKEANGNNY